MVYLVYDKSFGGLLTCVFEVYARGLEQVHLVRKGTELPLLTQVLQITTQAHRAHRVNKKLELVWGKEGMRKLWQGWLSEREGVDNIILHLVRYTLSTGQNIFENPGHEHVLLLQEILDRMEEEKHRLQMLVQFQKTPDGLCYAVVNPRFNVLPLIADHFSKRYVAQRWIIYDARRQYGLFFDRVCIHYITSHQNEDIHSFLSHHYFYLRHNRSPIYRPIHIQQVPRRYWAYLTGYMP